MAWFKGKKSIASVNTKLPREELLRISRILVVDDEEPELIKDLRNANFAVDYLPDITSANMNCIDRPIYDLILLDFGNVGKTFGADEGLSLLRHIKRVNPSIVVLSYTSKALKCSMLISSVTRMGPWPKMLEFRNRCSGSKRAFARPPIWSTFGRVSCGSVTSKRDRPKTRNSKIFCKRSGQEIKARAIEEKGRSIIAVRRGTKGRSAASDESHRGESQGSVRRVRNGRR